MRIDNIAGLDERTVDHLRNYFFKSLDEAIAVNQVKKRYVYEANMEGRRLIVKVYVHSDLKHRVPSFFQQSHADRYCAAVRFLLRKGLSVPVLVMKMGRGPLPEKTLFAMERVQGRMLVKMLPEVESNKTRIETLSKKISGLIIDLRQAGVIHRDLNTKNFLIGENDKTTLIDFDAASRYAWKGRGFQRRHRRDVQNFLSTCHNAPKFAGAVASLLSFV